MRTILVCVSSFDGHVTPMLAVVRALVEAGCRVRVLTGEGYAPAVEATGAEFIPLPPDAQSSPERVAAGKQHADGDRRSGVSHLITALRLSFLDQMPSQFRVVRELVTNDPVDAIVTDLTMFGVAALSRLPSRQRPPIIACGIVPVVLLSRDTAPPPFGILPNSTPLGRLRNRLLNVAVRHVVLGGIQRSFDDTTRSLTGRPLGDFFFDWVRGAELFAQFTVQSFEYPRSDAPANLHFLGPMRHRPAGALPGWWTQLDPARPVVLVTQGTIANLDFEELILPALRGLGAEDVNVVVTTGRRPVELLGNLPANTWAAEFIDYSLLMPHVDVLVTNGGYGSILAALERGVPIVTSGESEDKKETGARVQWAGVGVNLRTSAPREEQIRDAVREVLTAPDYRERALEVARDIKSAPGAEGLLPLIEDLLAT